MMPLQDELRLNKHIWRSFDGTCNVASVGGSFLTALTCTSSHAFEGEEWFAFATHHLSALERSNIVHASLNVCRHD